MKLRQKLAVVLASAMVATSIPVVTMAASSNSLQKGTLKVKKEAKFTQLATANAIRIKFSDAEEGDEEVFYLDLSNAKWTDETLAAGFGDAKADGSYAYKGMKLERQNDDTLKVTYKVTDTDEVITIPLFCEAKDGDAKVSVVNRDGSSVSNTNDLVFATTAEKKVTVKVESDKSFYTKGELSKIIIEEAYKGSLADGGEFTIELEDNDFYFVEGDECTLEGKYGFSNFNAGKGKKEDFKITVDPDDKGKATVKLPKFEGKTTGTYELTGIEVKCKTKTAEEGDFFVSIKGDDLTSELSNVKIAKVANYSMYVKMKDDKVKDVKAGRKEDLEFEVGENVDDSMTTNHTFDITLENGHWDYKNLVQEAQKAGKLNAAAADITNLKDAEGKWVIDKDDDYKKVALKIDSKWLAKQIIDNDGDFKIDTFEADFAVDDDKIDATTITVQNGEDKDGGSFQSNNKTDAVKFKIKACVPVDNKDKEKVTLKVNGRDAKDELTTTAVNIVNPFNATFEQAVLKTGLQGQVSGSVTLTETDKDMFQKGKLTFKIKKDDEAFGIYLTDAKAEVSSGLKGTKVDVKKGNAKASASMNIDLHRTSKEAASITFKDMKFTTDRTVPEGTYDLEIGGTTVDADNHTITIKDFIKITTANSEDIANSNGLAAATAVFTIDSTKYVVNGIERDMDAPAYISGTGSTMIPVRYVADAFGVSKEKILYANGVATIFAGTRTIQLTNGSNIAVVNGMSIPMAVKVENKNGRLYVPVGEMANILGINKSWDPAAKTATFSNVNTQE